MVAFSWLMSKSIGGLNQQVSQAKQVFLLSSVTANMCQKNVLPGGYFGRHSDRPIGQKAATS